MRKTRAENTTASTFAHEVLHLFGAMDLYLEGTEDASRRDQAIQEVKYRMARVFSIEGVESSIMASSRQARSHVDLGNAYAVSWLDEMPLE